MSGDPAFDGSRLARWILGLTLLSGALIAIGAAGLILGAVFVGYWRDPDFGPAVAFLLVWVIFGGMGAVAGWRILRGRPTAVAPRMSRKAFWISLVASVVWVLLTWLWGEAFLGTRSESPASAYVALAWVSLGLLAYRIAGPIMSKQRSRLRLWSWVGIATALAVVLGGAGSLLAGNGPWFSVAAGTTIGLLHAAAFGSYALWWDRARPT